MMKTQLASDLKRRRYSGLMQLVLASTIGLGAWIVQGVATAAEEAAAPVDAATRPVIVTKSMKTKALKDAAAGVRGEAPTAPSAPAAASGTPTSSTPQAQEPAPGAGAPK